MKIEEGKQKEFLYLRKRIIFEEIKFQYALAVIVWWPLVSGVIFLVALFCNVQENTIDKITNCCVQGGKIMLVFLIMEAVIDTVKHNRLIKNGKVVIAELDECKASYALVSIFANYNKVNCSYFDFEESKLWEFEGTFTDFTRNGGKNPALRDEWQIPVLVDEKNYKNYYVLTKELAYSYRSSVWEKPVYFTKVVREVDLTKIKNGTKFSTRVKFQ